MSARSRMAEWAGFASSIATIVALALWTALTAPPAGAFAAVLTPGDPDPNFGSGGQAMVPLVPRTGPSRLSFVSRPDGKILVGYDIPMLLDFGGVPDTNYRWTEGRDDLGRRCIALGGGCRAAAFALQGTDNLLGALEFRTSDWSFRFGVTRFASDGTLDTTFGAGGVVVTAPVGQGNLTSALAVLPDGKILVGGATFPVDVGNRLAFARFTVDGSVDDGFGDAGVIVTSIDGIPQSLLPQPDGSVVVVAVVDAGPSRPWAVPKVLVMRLLPSGELDPSFGNRGTVVDDFGGGSAWPSRALLQPDGRILVAVRHGLEGSPGGVRQFALMRLWPNGAADDSFGRAGRVVVQVGEDSTTSQAEDIALQADGKILVSGTVSQVQGPTGFRRIALARLNEDGSVDRMFAPGGVTLAWSKHGADGYGVGIQRDGRIVVAGFIEDLPVLIVSPESPKGNWVQSYMPAVFGFVGGNAVSVRSQRQARAVEYYHSGFAHYFVTAIAYEIATLDTDPHYTGHWTRTGLDFRAYSEGGNGSVPVCRFFSGASFAPKSSHFYTPFDWECAKVKNSPDWRFEGEVFAINLVDRTGNCSAGTVPLYRLYNDGKGDAPNHRYTTSLATRSQMIAQGWVPEGSGAGVIGCVPSP